MKRKWIPLTSCSILSLCLTALGFGSCQSKKFVQQQKEQHNELSRQLSQINNEQASTTARLAQLRNDYENIGRGECVYGGPNNMEEARRAMQERQDRQRKAISDAIQTENAKLDSLDGEYNKVVNKLNELENTKKRK